ncbi:unnamed protein product, partial [Rotaria sordida]
MWEYMDNSYIAVGTLEYNKYLKQ